MRQPPDHRYNAIQQSLRFRGTRRAEVAPGNRDAQRGAGLVRRPRRIEIARPAIARIAVRAFGEIEHDAGRRASELVSE